jgi:hypothetical protein
MKFKAEFNSIFDTKCRATLPNIGSNCTQALGSLDKKLDAYYGGHGFNSCLTFNCAKHPKVLFHTFWHIGSKGQPRTFKFNTRMLKLSVSSFFYTQNLCCTKLILWKTEHFDKRMESELASSFNFYIKTGSFEIKTFSLITICSYNGTYYQSSFRTHSICDPNSLRHFQYELSLMTKNFFNGGFVSLSDFLRFFILDFYSGIYFDGDVILLRDMNMLWNENFAYRWSYLHKWNTAVVGLNKYASSSIAKLIAAVVEKSASFDELEKAFHPQQLINIIRSGNSHVFDIYSYDGLRTFHSYFFDSNWLCADGMVSRKNNSICTFNEFGSRKFVNESEFKPTEFFKYSFAYHVHMSSIGRILNGSYLSYFESFYRKNLIYSS